MVPNPADKGALKVWQIPKPDFVEDLHPRHFRPLIGAVGAVDRE
jgi:hypothetical protein